MWCTLGLYSTTNTTECAYISTCFNNALYIIAYLLAEYRHEDTHHGVMRTRDTTIGQQRTARLTYITDGIRCAQTKLQIQDKYRAYMDA